MGFLHGARSRLWLAVCVRTRLIDRDLIEIYRNLTEIGCGIFSNNLIRRNPIDMHRDARIGISRDVAIFALPSAPNHFKTNTIFFSRQLCSEKFTSNISFSGLSAVSNLVIWGSILTVQRFKSMTYVADWNKTQIWPEKGNQLQSPEDVTQKNK